MQNKCKRAVASATFILYTIVIYVHVNRLKPPSHCPSVHPCAPRRLLGKPGRIVEEFECVQTFPAVLRTRPGLGQKIITVCPRYATVCNGTFPVKPRRRYGVSR